MWRLLIGCTIGFWSCFGFALWSFGEGKVAVWGSSYMCPALPTPKPLVRTIIKHGTCVLPKGDR